MTETTLPRHTVRLDASRPPGSGYGDLLALVSSHLRVHAHAEEFLGPYNARQRSSQFPYRAPDREELRRAVRQGSMNEFSYAAYLSALERFCAQHRGQRALPAAHPSTLHSLQLPAGAFELQNAGGETALLVAGAAEPLFVRGLRDPGYIRFVIVRPKLSRLGTAAASQWEALFFRDALGYVPEWVDSFQNPRYSGIIS